MIVDIIVPSVGESITEAILDQWYKQDGDLIKKDDPLFVIETDKVTLEVVAEVAGLLKILIPEGETVAIGAVVGTIDTEAVVGVVFTLGGVTRRAARHEGDGSEGEAGGEGRKSA